MHQYDLLLNCKELTHGVFGRSGGISPPPFDTLNVSYNVGDAPENVFKNREIIKRALSIPTLIIPNQVHGSEVQEAAPSLTCDGLITKQTNVGLLIQHADCQSALFYDPIQKALALVHAGWRGSVLNIYQKTIEKLRSTYGCKPENLLVGISPSLGPNAFEFKSYKKDLPSPFWDFQVKPFYFDFWALSRWQLQQEGVLPPHIEIAGICTYEKAATWFSHRSPTNKGRNATVALLLPQKA